MLRTRIAALTLTAAATLAASGCGGSKSPAAAPTLTRPQLISRADVICGRFVAARGSLKYRSQKELGRVLSRLASYYQTAHAELSELTPPASMTDDWRKIVAGVHALAEDNAKVGEYIELQHIVTARTLYVTLLKVRQQVHATTTRDGFKDCTQIA